MYWNASLTVLLLLFGWISINRSFSLPLKKPATSNTVSNNKELLSTLNQPRYFAHIAQSEESADVRGGGGDIRSFTDSSRPQPSFSPLRSTLSALYQLFTHSTHFFEKIVYSVISDPDLVKFAAKLCSYGFWTFFTLILLGTIGIDTKPLLSLVSVLGITVGFAAKDLLTNSFAGLFILLTRPFQRGDIITVSGFKGKVLSIDLRYVQLLSMDGNNVIMVPLSIIYGHAITIEKPSTVEEEVSDVLDQ